MTPSNHTTSLELSIALKEAGWPQEESLFYWQVIKIQKDKSSGGSLISRSDKPTLPKYVNFKLPTENILEYIAAPLASELMEQIVSKSSSHTLLSLEEVGENLIARKNGKYLVKRNEYSETIKGHYANSMPDALAKLALHLIQEGIIKF